MKFLAVILSFVLACNAAPTPQFYLGAPVQAVHVLAAPGVTQYHTQDALGQYSYGYSGGPSAKNEVKLLDGVTRGSYSYIDANSQLQTVSYIADGAGFRVAATNLPVDTNAAAVHNAAPPMPVEDTNEVKQARAEHFAAVAEAQAENSIEMTEVEGLPQQIEDTEEVKQAREEHLQAVEEAKARSSESEATPGVISHLPAVVAQHHVLQAPLVHAAHPSVIHVANPAAFHVASPYLLPAHGFSYATYA